MADNASSNCPDLAFRSPSASSSLERYLQDNGTSPKFISSYLEPKHYPQATLEKVVHPHFAILSATTHPAIAESNASHRPRVPSEGAFTLPTPWIPDFHRLIFSPGHDPQRIRSKRPHPFDVSKVRSDTTTGGDLPEPDGTVQRRGKHVFGRRRPVSAKIARPRRGLLRSLQERREHLIAKWQIWDGGRASWASRLIGVISCIILSICFKFRG